MKCTAAVISNTTENMRKMGKTTEEVTEVREYLIEKRAKRFDEEFEADETNYQLGDRYPGADKAYANKDETKAERYKKAIVEYYQPLVGSTVYVTDVETGKMVAKAVDKVRLSLGKYVELVYKDGKSITVNPSTGMAIDTMEVVEDWVDVPPFVMYDKEGSKVDWDSMTEQVGYVHGDKEHMLGMMERLHALGGYKETDAHYEYLRGLIGKMEPKFFEKMKLFVKEQSDVSVGIVEEGKGNRRHKLGIAVSKAPYAYANQQSEATIYAHEVVHSMLAFALESELPEARLLQRELNHVMDVAVNKTKWSDLLPEVSIDKEAEIREAKKMFAYIFTSENAKHEFMTHALTNPIVMKHLKNVMVKEGNKNITLLDKIGNFFATLLDIVMGKYEFKQDKSTAYEQVMQLSMKLADINNRHETEISSKTMLQSMFDKLNDADELLGEQLDKVIDNYLVSERVLAPKPEGVAKVTLWRMELIAKMMTNKHYQKYGKMVLSAYGMKPWGVVQNTLSDFGEADDLERSVHWLGLARDRIDSARMTIIGSVKKSVYDRFKRAVTKQEEIALTRALLDTDVGSIYGKKGYEQIADVRKLLESEEALNTRISRAKHALKLEDEKNYNWHVNQAHGLGYYMATHKAHIAQNFSAFNIARGLLSDSYKKPTKELIALIDEVATLTALKYTDKRQLAAVATLMKEQSDGVHNVIKLHQNANANARDAVFENSKIHMIKGYTREVFDDQISTEVAAVSRREELESRGYKMVMVLEKTAQDTYSEPVALFVSNTFSVSEYHNGATRLTKLGSKGTKIKDVFMAEENEFADKKAELVKLKLDRERRKLVKAMYEGTLDTDAIEYGMAPVIDSDGKVVDYRYMMNKEAKEDIMGQDVTVAEVLGRTYGHTVDKAQTLEHNEKVLDVVLKGMEENYIPGSTIGKDDLEYVEIGPDVADKEMRELYRILPQNFKTVINNRADKVIAVRGDLLLSMFGFRQASLANLMPGLTPTAVKTIIRMAEAIWGEIVKMYKVVILIKTPAVLAFNLLSNVLQEFVNGGEPLEILKMYKESFRDVREYIRKTRELDLLKVQKGTGSKVANIGAKIKLLQAQLAASPVHELMQLGMYSAIVEDAETAELRSSNKVKRKIDEFLKPVPGWVKTPLQIMYLSEETKFYKVMQETLQISDLIARDVANRRMKLQEARILKGQRRMPKWSKELLVAYVEKNDPTYILDKGVKDFLASKDATVKDVPIQLKFGIKQLPTLMKNARHYELLEMFINYNKPVSKLEEYFHRMGRILFVKYAKRVQKVIGQTGSRNPLKALMVLLGDSLLFSENISIFSQSLMAKDLTNLVYNMSDIALGVATPPLVQLATVRA